MNSRNSDNPQSAVSVPKEAITADIDVGTSLE